MEENKAARPLNVVDERPAKHANGWVMLFVIIGMFICANVMFALGIALGVDEGDPALIALTPVGLLIFIAAIIMAFGFKLLQPNEAYVLTLFGKYYGTLKTDGFYWTNPFCSAVNPARAVAGVSRKLSLKAMTLNNDKQKVNDEDGNPIEISVVVIWRITNTARAVFNVENYMSYISTQCDAAIRQVARQ